MTDFLHQQQLTGKAISFYTRLIIFTADPVLMKPLDFSTKNADKTENSTRGPDSREAHSLNQRPRNPHQPTDFHPSSPLMQTLDNNNSTASKRKRQDGSDAEDILGDNTDTQQQLVVFEKPLKNGDESTKRARGGSPLNIPQTSNSNGQRSSNAGVNYAEEIKRLTASTLPEHASFLLQRSAEQTKWRSELRILKISKAILDQHLTDGTLPKDLQFKVKLGQQLPKVATNLLNAEQLRQKEEQILLESKRKILKQRYESFKEIESTYAEKFSTHFSFDSVLLEMDVKFPSKDIDQHLLTNRELYEYLRIMKQVEIDEKEALLDEKYAKRKAKKVNTTEKANSMDDAMDVDQTESTDQEQSKQTIPNQQKKATKPSTATTQKDFEQALEAKIAETISTSLKTVQKKLEEQVRKLITKELSTNFKGEAKKINPQPNPNPKKQEKLPKQRSYAETVKNARPNPNRITNKKSFTNGKGYVNPSANYYHPAMNSYPPPMFNIPVPGYGYHPAQHFFGPPLPPMPPPVNPLVDAEGFTEVRRKQKVPKKPNKNAIGQERPIRR